MADTPTKRRERRKAERPGEILDAAFEEFVASGYAATRLEDVARRAGVTKGTIYFYFDTKERVFDEMIRHVSRPLHDELTAFFTTLKGPYRAQLHDLIVYLYRRFGDERASRETLRFLIAEGARFPDLVDRYYQEFMEPLVEHVRMLVDAGIVAGEFRDTAARRFPELLLSPSLLLDIWLLVFDKRRPIDVDAFVAAQLDLLMHGLAA